MRRLKRTSPKRAGTPAKRSRGAKSRNRRPRVAETQARKSPRGARERKRATRLPPKAKRIRVVTALFGAGPGMGGTSSVELRPTPEGWQVTTGGTALDEKAELGMLPIATTWRERVRFVAEYAENNEEVDVASVRVTGASDPEKQMLALAWSGTAGALAAQCLLGLADTELAQLASSRAIAAQECIETQELLSELEDDERRNVIRAVLDAGHFDWQRVREAAKRITEIAERAEEESAAARKRALSPYAAEIDRLVSAWWAYAGGATSAMNQWAMTARQAGVRQALEDFALAQNRLPEGICRVKATISRTPLDFELDVAALRAFADAHDPQGTK